MMKKILLFFSMMLLSISLLFSAVPPTPVITGNQNPFSGGYNTSGYSFPTFTGLLGQEWQIVRVSDNQIMSGWFYTSGPTSVQVTWGGNPDVSYYLKCRSRNISGWSAWGSLTCVVRDDDFIFNIDTELGNGFKEMLLPVNGKTYNCVINWGDGVIETKTGTANIEHTYNSGSHYYTISITGSFPGIVYADDDTYYSRFGEKITSVTQWGSTGLNNFSFWGCTNLSSIPTDLYGSFRYTTSMRDAFRGCINISIIPTGLLSKATQLTSVYGTFDSTTIVSIPTGLFDNCTKITDFSGTFARCELLSTIPTNLFRYNTLATSFYGTFAYNSSITTIPTDLFRYNIRSKDHRDTFGDCTSLTTIPVDLFRYNVQDTSFRWTFLNCSSITSIPTDLFRYNTAATIFNSTFRGCTSLTSIPSTLFSSNPLVTSFSATFSTCTNLTSIPATLFSSNPLVTEFKWTFQKCSLLTAVPTDLFRYNVEAIDFLCCFDQCFAIVSIPTDLFRYNPDVISFAYCFRHCPLTTSGIPTNLFRYNPLVVSFHQTFRNTRITQIPVDLFRYNPLVYSTPDGVTWNGFEACFYDCINLTSIPATIFDYNTAATNFKSTFYNCPALTGSAPALWNRTPASIGETCFFGDTGLSNYSSIPVGWK